MGPATGGEDGAAEAGAGVVCDDGVKAEAWGLSTYILEGIPDFLIRWKGGGREEGRDRGGGDERGSKAGHES